MKPRIPLGHCSLIASSLAHPLQIGQDGIIALEAKRSKHSHCGQWTDVHDVCGGEFVTCKPRVGAEPVLEDLQRHFKPTLGKSGSHIAWRWVGPRDLALEAESGLQVAIAKMQEIQIVWIIGSRWRDRQGSLAILGQNVFDDCP